MHRPILAALRVAPLLLLAQFAAAGNPEALDQAHRLLERNEARAAAEILEAALPTAASDRPALLQLLRQAYESAARQAEAAGKPRDAEQFRDNLAILNRKSKPKDKPPADEALKRASDEALKQAESSRPAYRPSAPREDRGPQPPLPPPRNPPRESSRPRCHLLPRPQPRTRNSDSQACRRSPSRATSRRRMRPSWPRSMTWRDASTRRSIASTASPPSGAITGPIAGGWTSSGGSTPTPRRRRSGRASTPRSRASRS